MKGGPANTMVSQHYGDVIMSTMASQITSVSLVYSTICSNADQRKHESSASLAFVRGIHRWLVNSPHKGPVTRKMFPFDDVIMVLKIARRDSQPPNAPISRTMARENKTCPRRLNNECENSQNKEICAGKNIFLMIGMPVFMSLNSEWPYVAENNGNSLINHRLWDSYRVANKT